MPASTNQTNNVVDEISAPAPISLRQLADNFTDSEIYPDVSFWLLWLIPPIIIFLLWIVVRLSQRVSHPKRDKALQSAYSQLHIAQQSETATAFETIEQAIFTYFSYRLDTPTSDLSLSDIKAIAKRLPENIRNRLFDCLEQVAAGRYAPISESDKKAFIKYTAETLSQIDRVWKRR